MKTKFYFLIFLTLISVRSNAQYAVGDYGSISTGNWGAGIWGIWNGAAWGFTAGSPGQLTNVFILAGTTVTVTASPMTCNNLTVEAGAILWAGAGTNLYISVFGSSLVCNGQIGNGAIFDQISFNIEGINVTISGTGTFDASRMRKSSTFNKTTNLTITRDVNLRWNSASASAQLYNNATLTTFNVTINAGVTVNLIQSGPSTGNVCIDGNNGADVIEGGGTFTVNGTLIVSGILYLTTNNTNLLYPSKWVVNGLLKVYEVIAALSGVATNSLTINTGGKLDITGTPAFSSLSVTNNSYIFNNGSTVQYSAAGNQAVRVASEFGVALLNQYYNLILTGSGLKSTSITNLYIRNDITISGTAIFDPNPVNSNILVGGNWLNYNSIGFSEKTTTVNINGGSIQTITCPGGEVYNILRYQKTASSLQFNNAVDVINMLLFSSTGYVDLNSNILTVRNTLTTGISGQNATRYIVSEKMDNSSKIVWRINAATGVYTFPFGVPPGGAANYIPVVLTKANDSLIGDVTISTYGTPADNLTWPITPIPVTNLNSYFPIHNNPDNRHWTVDRFWEVRATTPVAVDSVRFSYRTIELPDSDATPTNLGAQYWNTINWYIQQYGIGIANNVGVPSFSIFNTSWTLTSLISPLSFDLNDGNACTIDGYDPSIGIYHNPINSDDGNPCTFDDCNTLTGVYHTPIATNDNNACTIDACDSNTGISHTLVNIDDNNDCTKDACNTSTGTVSHTPANIDDGNSCTTDACNTSNGNVTHTPLATINDGNACTIDACDNGTGIITHTDVIIDDSNACTTDACNTGTGIIINIDVNKNDNNACTTDACDTGTGTITHTNVIIEDSNICTTDACNTLTGFISHTPIADDGNACTTDACDTDTGIITHTDVIINDNNACTVDACNTETGVITHTDVIIDDINACTIDACDTGTGSITHTDVIINDNDACTTDACDPSTGAVTHTVLNIDDNDACTTDACDPVSGPTYIQISITDSNVCTTDACDPVSGLSHTPINISDYNLCTTDACDPISGVSHTAININDNNACTTDACDPSSGVISHNAILNINDGNACTLDGCNSLTGEISHTEININDNDVCTIDACDVISGNISHTTINVNDNNECTFDFCHPIFGAFHILNNVDDGNACTIDECNPTTGFVLHLVVNTNDNNVCTTDGCDSTTGVYHNSIILDDNNVCTIDLCHPSLGVYHLLVNNDDNNVCTTDGCNSLTGIFHTPINIDDNNLCTTDACDPIFGISHITLPVVDDNNVCTNDGCDPAVGSTHIMINISDNNICTTDACDPINGASHTTLPIVNDNNLCTTDGCDSFTGPTHEIISIDDINVCTSDACDPLTGISHISVSTGDSNVCTTDACDPITGVSHTEISITDNNVCTLDACDPITGVSHTALAIVDDNDACTIDDCDPFTGPTHIMFNISDGNVCTIDACDPATGNITNTLVNIDDGNACTTDECNSITGTTHTLITVDDNNDCTIDACESQTGIITHRAFAEIVNNDMNICSGSIVNLTTNLQTGLTSSLIPTNGLVGWWPFNGNAIDESGNGNNGTVNGAVLSNDRFGNSNSAYGFNGINSYIDIPNYFFNNGWPDYSISFWFNTSTHSGNGHGQTFINTNPHNGFNIGYSVDNNQRIYNFKNSNPSVASWDILSYDNFNFNPVNLNTWIQVAIVKNGNTYIYFVNGVQDKIINTGITPLSYLCALRIGSITCCNTDYFNGKIDDIGIWNRVLTFSEIQQLYQSSNVSYLWSNGATTPNINVSPSQTTTYFVTVSNSVHTCTDSVTVTVLNPDDSNACTIDVCDPSTLNITHTPLSIDDGNVCTTDGCNTLTGPTHDLNPVEDDGNVCTTDGCNSIIGPTHELNPIEDDGNACTTDGCNSITGPTHELNSIEDDGNVCTTDGCDSFTGVYHILVNVEDGNICTTDGCYTITGIFHIPININDNDVCTLDGCDSFSGISHILISSDDNNACTIDGCDSFTGVYHNSIIFNSSFSATICQGDNYLLPWGNVASTEGNYSYTYNSILNCDSIFTVHLFVNPVPLISTNSNSPVCSGNVLNLYSSGGASYNWTGPNGFISSLQSPEISNATSINAGNYTATISNQADIWTQKSDMGGTSRYFAVGLSIGSKGYIGTGWDANGLKQDFWEYDQTTDTWTQKANFGGSARYLATGFSIGLKGYIGTGFDGTSKNDFWEYDQTNNTWTQKANFGGTVRYGAVSFSIGTLGYLGTGLDGNNRKDFWEYNPNSDTWTQKSNFGGTGRVFAVGFNIGLKGYIGTGNDGNVQKDFWEYNPLSDAWIQKTNYGGDKRFVATGFSIGSKGYIGTGYNEASTYYNDFWEYDSNNDLWTQKANFGGTVRGYAVGFSIGGKGYIGTGHGGAVYTKDFWEYNSFNECASTATIAVVINPLPTSTPESNSPICIGSTLNLTSNGGTSYSWTGPNGFTSEQQNPVIPLVTSANAGNYNVIISNENNCTSTFNTTVTINPLPFVSITASGLTSLCNGDSVTLTARNSSTYLWSTGATTQSIITNTSGSYTVTVTNEFNCSTTSASTSVQTTTCPVTLHLRFFIQGFYLGGGIMRATIDPNNLPLVCDIVKIELHNPTPPYARVRFLQGTINTDGRGNFTFPSQVAGHSYYIVIKHRNTIETWSKYPVLFNGSAVDFDFTRE